MRMVAPLPQRQDRTAGRERVYNAPRTFMRNERMKSFQTESENKRRKDRNKRIIWMIQDVASIAIVFGLLVWALFTF